MSSVFNRRNAFIGWLTVVFGRKLVALKLKSAPEPEPKVSGKAKKGAIAVLVAGAVGVATFLRLRSRGGDDDAADTPADV
jgi:hypothetical protein